MRRARRAKSLPRQVRSADALALKQVDDLLQLATLRKYARLANGNLVRCMPSRDERRGLVARAEAAGSDWKVIFDTAEAALACSHEFTRLFGYPPMRAYPCGRSKHGHVHLTLDQGRRRRP